MKNLILLLCLMLASGISANNSTGLGLTIPTRLLFPFHNLFGIPNNVKFQLYTRINPDKYTTIVPHSDNLGYFHLNHPTRIVIHGWFSSTKSLVPIKDAYLSVTDHNVILVDWWRLARFGYIFAKTKVNPIGEYLASLIDFLVTKGVNLTDTHIIGHSLGAHIAGVAGQRIVSGKLGKITGLDPAFPLFFLSPPDERLDKTSATFVEAIHTAGGLVAISNPIGHVDFYPNNGVATQPGCGFDILERCSHSRARELFKESITTKVGFVGYRCSGWDEFKGGRCYKNSNTLMGEYTNQNATGNYFLETSSSSPFALGYKTN